MSFLKIGRFIRFDSREIEEWVDECRRSPSQSVLLADYQGTDAGTARHVWIWEENVGTLFETISRWIDYTFDDSDRTAIVEGLKTTDVENGDWYSYPLIGTPTIDVDVAPTSEQPPLT